METLGTVLCVLAVAALGRFREEDQRPMYGTTPPTKSLSLPYRLAVFRPGAMSKGRQAHYVALLRKRAQTMEEVLSQALWAVSIQTGQNKGCSARLHRNTTGRADRGQKNNWSERKIDFENIENVGCILLFPRDPPFTCPGTCNIPE